MFPGPVTPVDMLSTAKRLLMQLIPHPRMESPTSPTATAQCSPGPGLVPRDSWIVECWEPSQSHWEEQIPNEEEKDKAADTEEAGLDDEEGGLDDLGDDDLDLEI